MNVCRSYYLVSSYMGPVINSLAKLDHPRQISASMFFVIHRSSGVGEVAHSDQLRKSQFDVDLVSVKH
ncbi:MAG: hypothetical protein JWM99_1427 [Verrucomicrobiales bacterium]|nr:hypothetical protein [Verrucomicrobiales bacterium]